MIEEIATVRVGARAIEGEHLPCSVNTRALQARLP